MEKKARVIAFYLPQFHPTPENDKYWGKGFTEWTNVAKAHPLFKGHYQPRIPADLGFYDLRLPIIREQQAEMARDAGIEGFMYWHYWFGNNIMTLEKPFEAVLESGKPHFPFCLGWANHSWSNKTWIKNSSFQRETMIFAMTYPGKQDIINHFNYCLPAFKDKRYIKVDGKPLFMIWDGKAVPNVREFMNIWRKMAQENGLNGIFFTTIRYGKQTRDELMSLGFDSINNSNQKEAEDRALDNVFLKKTRSLFTRLTNGAILRKFDYGMIIKNLVTSLDTQSDVFPTIIAGYDRTARAGRNATIYYNCTPQLFEKHVSEVIDAVKDKIDDRRIIFLKSWNEWAEGNYVEPDLKYGHGFLDAIRNRIY